MAPFFGNNTAIGGVGDDQINPMNTFDGSNDLVFGNQGNDLVAVVGGSTVYGGLGNDLLFASFTFDLGNPLLFGNEGSDTIDASQPTGSSTVVGGNDSADGADSIVTGSGADWLFGNGGGDTLNAGNGANTVVGGQGGDSLVASGTAALIFANEGDDTVFGIVNAMTVFGGQGNDYIITSAGRDTIQGNEGNDTFAADGGIDTISGGAGNDVFAYEAASSDGDNAAGGGPIELITDVNWAEDRFDTIAQVTFAANVGAGTGANLQASATNAIAAAYALSGGGPQQVAAQFTFGGHAYLAINQDPQFNTFNDPTDLLIDITGATGTIGTSNFI